MARVLILWSLLLVAVGGVQAGPHVESWTTQNGAKVMYVHAPDLPMIDVRVVFDAGGARDGDLPGLAAFTNDLLTEGAGDWDADTLALRLEDRGIQVGSGALRDMAWLSVRSLTDPAVLDVAVDSARAMLAAPRFDEPSIERTRQQLQIALRSSQQSPAAVGQRAFFAALYGDHPYAHPIGGDEKSLPAITRPALVDFHRKYYVGANAVVAIVGAVNREAAEGIAQRIVGELPAGEHAPALPPAPTLSGSELRQAFPSSQTHIFLGQTGIARDDPDYFALYVGNHVLGGGSLVSLLGEEVRNKRGLSYSVYSALSPMRAAGPFMLVAQTKNQNADEALNVMRDTLARFVEAGPTEQELDDAKRNLIGGFPLRIASNAKIVEYIAMMGFYGYPLDYLDTLPDKLAAVNVEQVRDAFRRRISPQGMIAVVIGGDSSGT